MESSDPARSPVLPNDALAALRDAAEAKRQLARDLRLPSGYSVITGVGNAAFVFGVAVGNSERRFASLAFVVGLVVQLVASGSALRRFKRLNGASLSGFGGPRAAWPVLGLFCAILIPLIVMSTWLMIDGHGEASALVALCALPLTAAGDRWWIARYRAAA